MAAAIREELVQLSAEARLALDAAAVAGESFEPELVAAIADRPPSLAMGVLDELVEADVIRPSEAPGASASGIRSSAPSYMRACQADGGSVLTPGRQQRSRPTKLRRSRTPTMSNGQPRAGDEDAIALLVHAARTAAPRAPLTAGRWLRAALRLLRPEAERERHLELLSESAAAFAAAGAYEDALEAVEDALVMVPRRDVGQRANLIVRIAEVKQHSVRRFESQAMLKEALSCTPPPRCCHRRCPARRIGA